jgi:hypothetical protein
MSSAEGNELQPAIDKAASASAVPRIAVFALDAARWLDIIGEF